MQTVAITEAKMSDLVSFYNAHTVRLIDGKKVNKFADRKTAEKRVHNLVESLASYFEKTNPDSVPPEGFIFVGELTTDEGEPVKIEAVNATPVTTLQKDEGADEEQEEDEAEENHVNSFGSMSATLSDEKHEPKPSTVVIGRASNSEGVRLSWLNPVVKAERLTRDSVVVTVDGVESSFKSTREAFRELRLPISKHIRFRLKLKAARTATFESGGKAYHFEIREGEAIDE